MRFENAGSLRFFTLSLLVLPLRAMDDAACDAKITKLIATGGAAVKLCVTTERLVPRRRVVFAVLNFDEQSEQFGNRVLVLDYRAAADGRREALYEDSRGIDIQPFLFRGKRTLVAISDFDHSGRTGWAIVREFDTGTSLDIQCWDPSVGGFRKLLPWAKNEEGWYQQQAFYIEGELHGPVELTDGEIRLPAARPILYRLNNGRFEMTVRNP